MPKGYTALNLPTSLVEELKVWKVAFDLTYGRKMSYEKILRSMIDSLADTDPAVVETLDNLIKARPELIEKLGSFSSVKGQ